MITINRPKLLASTLIGLLAALCLGYFWSIRNPAPDRNSLLSSMPEDAQAVLFVEVDDLRHAPFFAPLLAAAPKPGTDPAYQKFVRDTGFDYEKDLFRIALAITQQNGKQFFFAVADGHFDRKKISAYAAKNGAVSKFAGAEIFTVPVEGASSPISFRFLRKDRIAFTNQTDSQSLLQSAKSSTQEWQTRFQRVAGSPVFAVIRSDGLKEIFASPAAAQEFARRAPGGLSSPQLSSLLAQLQWLTVAAKSQNDKLRVVADAESFEDTQARHLADFLNGLVLLARIGLSNPSTRQQIGSATRDSYMSLLNSAEVSRLDRDDTKSVRLIFDVSPNLLTSAQLPLPSPAAPNKK